MATIVVLASFLFRCYSDATCPVCSDRSNCQTVGLLGHDSEMCLATLEVVVKVLEVSSAIGFDSTGCLETGDESTAT